MGELGTAQVPLVGVSHRVSYHVPEHMYVMHDVAEQWQTGVRGQPELSPSLDSEAAPGLATQGHSFDPGVGRSYDVSSPDSSQVMPEHLVGMPDMAK